MGWGRMRKVISLSFSTYASLLYITVALSCRLGKDPGQKSEAEFYLTDAFIGPGLKLKDKVDKLYSLYYVLPLQKNQVLPYC